jgi:hypothetical protein
MANAAHYQSSKGNFPIIIQQRARLLQGALLVAKQAAQGEIDNPGISFCHLIHFTSTSQIIFICYDRLNSLVFT